MLLPDVEYARPDTIDDAIAILSENPGARVLAGGQTLVNVMKARAAAPDVLVDLGGLAELKAIRRRDGVLELGAMATLADVMLSADVADARPILAEVAVQVADVQVRNRGTIGGNVCANDPTNHFPPVMVALGATMRIAGRDGERTVPAEEFFLGVYLTAVGPGDVLTAIEIPVADGRRDGFASVTVGRDGTCIANAAAAVDGEARIALGCVAAVPVALRASADPEAVRRAVREADLDPPSDVHAPGHYRRHLAEVCAVRALAQAIDASR